MEQEEKILDILSRDENKFLPFKTIAELMGVLEGETGKLKETLDMLTGEGRLVKTRKGRYALPERVNQYSGVLRLAEGGFGFVTIDQEKHLERGSRNDRFIPEMFLNGAMDGDRVLVEDDKTHFRPRSTVIRILDRKHKTLIGSVVKGRIFPDDRKVLFHYWIIGVGKDELADLEGKKAVFKIIEWPDGKSNNIIVEVERILGHLSDPFVDILSVMHSFGLKEDFDREVLDYGERTAERKSKQVKTRVDLRGERIFTIDGDDAKDLDDGVSIEKTPEGFYKLGVHIADVSHYVEAGSSLDREAYDRGTSVYLLNRVVPMLPGVLSNHMCSLNPRTDKLALSVVMTVDGRGNVVNHRIFESLINSRERMTYDNVYKIIRGEPNIRQMYSHLVGDILLMEELALILKNKRFERGAMDFNFKESKIVLDDRGKAVDVLAEERTIAENIIEEFMILCNETVAEQFFWSESPFVYRIHEEPDPEKMMEFAKFVNIFGYRIKGGGKVHSRELVKLIEGVRGKKEEKLINTVLLRSLKKARYSSINLNHYSLGSMYYCHFTSPIRRYPDLLVHRIVKESINGTLDAKKMEYYRKNLEKIAYHCSERERNADNAEDALNDIKKAEYMEQFIGDTFKGMISSVTSFGMFVDLENTVEGLIPMELLGWDNFVFNDRTFSIKGEMTGKEYRIGDEVYVTVSSANKTLGQVNFTLADRPKRKNRK